MNPSSSSSSELQLVPETLLKRRHDLDALQAKRAASALTTTNSRKKSIAASASGSKSIKIIKPETILARSRHRTNGSIRFRRVSKRGMQKRASDKVLMKRKVWDASKDEEADDVAVVDDNEKKATDAKSVDGTTSTSTTANDDDATTTPNNLLEIQYKANSVGASSVFAVLLRPTDASTSKPIKKTLSTLRLRRVHEGVFLPYNSSTRKMLHLVEPYVLYGVLSLETVSDLVRRRGHCKVEGKRVPLSDNNVIEQQLGEELGLICVEDLVQVLSTAGEVDGDGSAVFGKVAKFLWPFRLTSRKSKFQRNMLQLKDGKLYGDQGELMNGYIREML
ncbi:hypothetical protein ACHAWU_008668 [Discostella pseudostelligera]|uniref:Large ribosomal subunit protein uL30-like ferredoxin-like fold domain-containing protein n=1 Tax=Discostella pseudostelligera TaxID=259834 RepID=A0ABD3M8S8_9STRA